MNFHRSGYDGSTFFDNLHIFVFDFKSGASTFAVRNVRDSFSEPASKINVIF